MISALKRAAGCVCMTARGDTISGQGPALWTARTVIPKGVSAFEITERYQNARGERGNSPTIGALNVARQGSSES